MNRLDHDGIDVTPSEQPPTRLMKLDGVWYYACDRCGYRSPAEKDLEQHRCKRWPRLREWARWTGDTFLHGQMP